jgi:hypothetical protein
MMIDLFKVREEILEILKNRYESQKLSFLEEKHIYFMNDVDGNLRDDWKSVSKVLKYFYEGFDAENIAQKKSKGDLTVKQALLDEWSKAGELAVNMGSRIHFLLEKESLKIFNIEKEVRQPIFECDFDQILKSDAMIQGGIKFLNLMKERGALLLDTEVVLGSAELGYVGQADKIWLIENKNKDGFGIIVSDYKSNKPKNFVPNSFTKKMKFPFIFLDDTALGHYSVQLPLYGKLFLKMLEGSKYENIKLYGCIIVLLKDDSEFEEFRVGKGVMDTVLTMDVKKYLK